MRDGKVEACLAGAGNTERVTQQADRTELYWGRRDEDVVQGQDLNYRTRRRMPVYVRCDLCDNVIRQAALQLSVEKYMSTDKLRTRTCHAFRNGPHSTFELASDFKHCQYYNALIVHRVSLAEFLRWWVVTGSQGS